MELWNCGNSFRQVDLALAVGLMPEREISSSNSIQDMKGRLQLAGIGHNINMMRLIFLKGVPALRGLLLS
jgi:hypothetical protein